MRWTLCTIGLVASVAAVFGCATGGSTMSKADAIAARQKLMKEQGAALKSMQQKAKAGQIQAVAADAEKLVHTSKRIPTLFPEGSLDPATSRAKPVIWQKWPEFQGNAARLGAKASQLVATARTGDRAATSAAIADIGKTVCGECHTTFRGPEIKK